jgi:hypothetical protein
MKLNTPIDQIKLNLWETFTRNHEIDTSFVPLFDTTEGHVNTLRYGRNKRPVLKRSAEMDKLMRSLGGELILEHNQSQVIHDGILYMMLKRGQKGLVPLYIGKTEIFGRGDRNLSANISDLERGNGKFGRWGYNYAYHIGDLSAVTLPGHPDSKGTNKYSLWRDSIFSIQGDQIKMTTEILFWATLWGRMSKSIWHDYGSTKLAFEEYLLIGVASDVFPHDLLNQEGRTR